MKVSGGDVEGQVGRPRDSEPDRGRCGGDGGHGGEDGPRRAGGLGGG